MRLHKLTPALRLIAARPGYGGFRHGPAAAAAPGSRLVLDYKRARHLIPEHGLPLTDKLDRLVARLGEPMVSDFTPEDLHGEMSHIGFSELETLPPEAQAHRYLQDGRDMPEPAPNFSFALYVRTGAAG